ncbi:type VI secretion system membrane subunit TssM [Azospirillum palustre]|uniref:Type VI secretion system membrane subunit TssM n=1 Tax=Azospirillum palustre TaxID=2044885 RepID=A0A2B8B7N0_9PROT|nr:type VI secretion system membrane subunit TssM [Azospirillum palustre]PGH54726.1 type VI secretion system membrane subunit TssM [Azospirillum palustre]
MAEPASPKAGAPATAKTAVRRRKPAAAAPSPYRSARSRWVLSLSGVLALGLAGWLLLPRLAATFAPHLLPTIQPDWSVRLLPLVLALAGWIAVNRRIDARERAANARLLEALAARRDPELKASLEEIGAVRKRLDGVLAQLRKRRGGRYLYQLPWYLVIGAPGSGKTTALANAGLAARPADGTMAGPLAGLGGTRNCDWWFTDRAVLIDTAGRYTTQDSRRAVDGRVWSGLLDLLKEHRPRQPANGVLLTVSIPELTGWTDAERRNHAILIRQRLNELRVQLGVRLPVYLLLTKADLLDGFATFFDPLDREARGQVWGLTLPADEPAPDTSAPGSSAGPLPVFRALYAGLVRRLDERLLDRLHQEPDIRRRSAVFALPLRVAELEPALADIVDTAFGSEHGEETPRLRGLYLTSATQTDASLALLAPEGGPEGGAEGGPEGGPGTGSPASTYFLERLLPDVVFPEANLARVDRRVERARRRRALLSAAAALALALAVGGWWLVSARGNAALLERADAGAAAVEAALRPLDTAPRSLVRVDDADPAAILPALEALRALPFAFDDAQDRPGQVWAGQLWAGEIWTGRLWAGPALAGGLYQGGRIAAPAQEAYRRALRSQFLARIALRLEERLRADWALPDQLRQTLRVYRMITGRMIGGQMAGGQMAGGQMAGGSEPMDAGAMAEWLALDWQRTLPGPANEARRRALGDHLAALFAVGFAPVPPDEVLVARVLEVLAQSTPQASSAQSGRAAQP